MMSRLRSVRSFVVLGAIVALAGPHAGEAARIGTIHGALRIGIDMEPDTLVPQFATSNLWGQLSPLMFDQLVAIDESGNLIPVLARDVPTRTNGGISADGKTVTFRLRDGIRWHDGKPLTSHDVAFTQTVLDDPSNAIVTQRIVKRVETPDVRTVVFRLLRPDATALLDVSTYVLPEHVLAGVSNLRKSDFNANPIGSGPFRFVRWARGERIELAANDDYVLGKPGLRKIRIELMPSADSEYAALLAGSIDWVITSGPRILRAYGGTHGLRAVEVPRYTWYGMALNLQRGPLRDVRVRRAISMAIDRTELAKVYLGTAIPAGGDIPNFSWAYDPAEAAPTYDLAGARALMRDAGWIDRGDGILRKDGVALDLRLTSVPFFNDIDVQVQAQLRRLGAVVDIRTYTLSQYYGYDGIVQKGQFDLGVIGAFADPDPNDVAYLSCDRFSPGGQNASHYCDPEMDALLRASVETEDRSVRKRTYARIERKIASDVPYIYLLWPKATTLISEDLNGFHPGPGAYTWNAWTWSI